MGYLFYKSNPRKAKRKTNPIFIGFILSFVKINRRPTGKLKQTIIILYTPAKMNPLFFEGICVF